MVFGFVGRFEHSLDDKGRLILPVRFRPHFTEGSNLTPYFEGCLALWPASEFTRQMREMQDLSRQDSASARNRARMWSQGSAAVDVDRQGRLMIPATARTFADLATDVLVIGAIDHLELWNPNRFAERVVPAEQYFNGSDLDQ